MMSNKTILLFLILVLIPITLAANLEIESISEPDPLCPGSTGLYTDLLTNNGGSPLQVTIISSGSASDFSTTVPQGFVLQPGQSKAVYTYISPRTTTTEGDYSIKVSAEAGTNSAEITHPIIIRDCYEYSLSLVDQEKRICPGQEAKFDFRLENNGNYLNTYGISLQGEYASKVTLSDTFVSLPKEGFKIINAYVQSSEVDMGTKEFTLVSTPNIGSYPKSQEATVILEECYNFDVSTQKDLINTCDHNIVTIPVTIQNKGTTENTYNLQAIGPAWANVENNKATIPAGDSKTVNLILNPDYGVDGSFQVTFKATPQKGTQTVSNSFNVLVDKCHAVTLITQQPSDELCAALEKTYGVTVRNNGKVKQTFSLDISGVDWASLDQNSITLDPGQEKEITLTINPSTTTPAGTYNIEVTAQSTDSNKIKSSDTITINTRSQQDCYKVRLDAEEKKIKVYYDSTATIPLIVENQGIKTTTYTLSLTGTASEFVYLNPSVIELEPTQSEIIYLYAAPSSATTDGVYSITVSAQTGDNAVLSTETISIEITQSRIDEFVEEHKEDRGGIIDYVIDTIAEFFASLTQPGEPTVEEDVEEIPEEEEEVIEEPEEEVEEEVEEETTLEELTIKNTMLPEGGTEQFILNGSEHTIEFTTKASENSIILTITSDPITLDLVEGESKKLDVDGDGTYDLKVTFNGYVDGEADITYEQISELIEEIEEIGEEIEEIEELPEEEEEIIIDDIIITDEEETPEEGEAQEGITGSFLGILQNSTQNIGGQIAEARDELIALLVIILAILLIIRFDIHKKILKFFEEEIEEEPPAEGPKPEEPKPEEKKEEPKKEEVKEPPKEEEEDEDEVIIEFDEDEEK